MQRSRFFDIAAGIVIGALAVAAFTHLLWATFLFVRGLVEVALLVAVALFLAYTFRSRQKR